LANKKEKQFYGQPKGRDMPFAPAFKCLVPLGEVTDEKKNIIFLLNFNTFFKFGF
jgi:hypothetical protein